MHTWCRSFLLLIRVIRAATPLFLPYFWTMAPGSWGRNWWINIEPLGEGTQDLSPARAWGFWTHGSDTGFPISLVQFTGEDGTSLPLPQVLIFPVSQPAPCHQAGNIQTSVLGPRHQGEETVKWVLFWKDAWAEDWVRTCPDKEMDFYQCGNHSYNSVKPRFSAS